MVFGYSACDITTPFHLWCNIPLSLCERNDEMLKMLVCSLAIFFFCLRSVLFSFNDIFVAGVQLVSLSCTFCINFRFHTGQTN